RSGIVKVRAFGHSIRGNHPLLRKRKNCVVELFEFKNTNDLRNVVFGEKEVSSLEPFDGFAVFTRNGDRLNDKLRINLQDKRRRLILTEEGKRQENQPNEREEMRKFHLQNLIL